MASLYIGKTRHQVSLQKAKKPGTSNVTAGFRLSIEENTLLALSPRGGAVGVERSRQLLGDRRRGRGFDRRTLHQVYQVPIAQNRNGGRVRRMSAKVAPSLLRGFAVLSCEHRHCVVGLGRVLHRQANSGTHLAGGTTADGGPYHHRRSGLCKRRVDIGRAAGLCYASASQLLTHWNHHNLWIHLLSPLVTLKLGHAETLLPGKIRFLAILRGAFEPRHPPLPGKVCKVFKIGRIGPDLECGTGTRKTL